MTGRRALCWCLTGSLALSVAPNVILAQKKAGGKKTAKAEADAKKGTTAPEAEASPTRVPFLPDVDFDAGTGPSSDLTQITKDKDETPEGRQRLQEIEARAKTIFRDSDVVMNKRRPFALDRDTKAGQLANARSSQLQDQQSLVALNVEAAEVKQQLSVATGGAVPALRMQLANLQGQGNAVQMRINKRVKRLNTLSAEVDALNIQVQPFDERLEKLWQELTEARKQWLEQRQPLEKYGRGDFEGLRRVLDAWLLVDGRWPNAFAWAALCSYELHDYDKAMSYLEKAENLNSEIGDQSKGAATQVTALSGLILSKVSGQSEKASKAITAALRDVDKKAGWETYFLVGRYFVDRDRELLKAKANLEMALKIKPNCPSARLWLARIQTRSSNEKIRDLNGGTKTLEYLWESSGERSWRLAYFLFEAYQRASRSADANRLWERTLELAPPDQQDQLKKDRTALLESTADQ